MTLTGELMGILIGDEPGWIERRSDRRVQTRFEVVFRILSEDEFSAAQVAAPACRTPVAKADSVNLSLGGLAIDGDFQLKLDRPLACGTKLAIEFSLPEEAGVVKALAEIAWAQPAQVQGGSYAAGLRFLNVEKEGQLRIQKYIAQA